MNIVTISEHDQDPLDYKAGRLARVPSGVGPIAGGIHDHERSNGQRYRHSHVGFDQPHAHLRDDVDPANLKPLAQVQAETAETMRAQDTIRRIARATQATCDADAKRGTGTGMCNRPLDEHGNCDRAGAHL